MKLKTLHIAVLVLIKPTFAAETISPEELEKIQASNNTAAQFYSFDARSLFGGGNRDIDLKNFVGQDTTPEGSYSLNTYVNDQSLGQLNLQFKHLDAIRSAVLCLDQDLLARLDLRQEVLKRLADKPCLTIKELDPQAYYNMDRSNLSLAISLPLTLTNNRPKGYISPDRFDKGVTSAFIGYDFNTFYSKYQDRDSTSTNFVNLNGGLNFKGFNFRHLGSFDSEGSSLKGYRSYLNTISTDLLPLEARITAGDFYTYTYNLDSAQIRGVQISTDNSMRPMSQRSYAPLIKGIANTNALVSVFQNGRKIYERTIPAGDFEINDLTAISNNGDLTVEVTENGGEKSSFIVPLQGNLNLLRMGQLNYSAAAGRYKLSNSLTDEYIGQLSLEYGLSNYLSAYAGSNLSENYKSYQLGLGANTFLGGVRFDVEQSDASVLDRAFDGQKLRLSYQYHYSPLKSSLSFNSLHQSKQYMTLSNTMSLLNYANLTGAEASDLFRTYHLKNQNSISLYQNFPNEKYGSLYLSASRSQYWINSESFHQYNIGYSNRWNKLNYSLGIARSANYLKNSQNETRFNLSLTMPLEWSSKRANLYSNIQHSNTVGSPTTAYVGVSGTAGDNNQISYGLNTNNTWSDQSNVTAVNANFGYNLPQVVIGGVAGWSDDHNYQYSLNARGSVVAHPYGVTLSNSQLDTYTIIHAAGAKGADVNNSWGSKIDRFGNAIYAGPSPYEYNSIAIDSKNLPIDVELNSNQIDIAPRRYSSTLVKFESKKTSNILLNVNIRDNLQLPIGIQAKTSDNKIVGMFGQSNQLFVEDETLLKQPILVQWGAANEQSCQINPLNNLIKNKSNKQFNMIDVECK